MTQVLLALRTGVRQPDRARCGRRPAHVRRRASARAPGGADGADERRRVRPGGARARGAAGYACALRAAQLGLRVALVERDLVGGTCLHYGCIPTKAILHAAEVADAARDGARFGVHASVDKIDLAGVRSYARGGRRPPLQGPDRARRLPRHHRRRGRGPPGARRRRPGRGGDEVGERTLTAPYVVLASGSQSKTLPGPGAGRRTRADQHRRASGCETLPTSAVVLGGGVIGVELASAWRSFGVEVTVVEALDRLVPGEDPAASAALLRAFRKRGITVRTASPVRSVETLPTGVRVALDDEDGTTLEADLVLVAVGRGPRSAGMGYEEAGVALDRGYVDGRRAAADLGARRVRRRRPGPRAAAGPPRLRARHLRGRGRRAPPGPARPRAGPGARRADPARHLLRPRGRVGRAERGGGPRPLRRRGDPDLRPRRQRQGPDPADLRASSSSSGAPTARSSASTWSGPGSAS